MTRQNISVGLSPNDNQGDSLRQAAQKINESLGELYSYLGGDSDVLPYRTIHHRSAVVTADGPLVSTIDFYVFNKATTLNATLSSGTLIGEHKFMSNRGVGSAIITTNLMGSLTTLTLAQHEATQLIWDGQEWFVVGNQSVLTLT